MPSFSNDCPFVGIIVRSMMIVPYLPEHPDLTLTADFLQVAFMSAALGLPIESGAKL